MRVAADPEVARVVLIFAVVLAGAILGGLLARRLRAYELRVQAADGAEAGRCDAPHPHETFRCTRLPHDPLTSRHHNHARNVSWGLPHVIATRPGDAR